MLSGEGGEGQPPKEDGKAASWRPGREIVKKIFPNLRTRVRYPHDVAASVDSFKSHGRRHRGKVLLGCVELQPRTPFAYVDVYVRSDKSEIPLDYTTTTTEIIVERTEQANEDPPGWTRVRFFFFFVIFYLATLGLTHVLLVSLCLSLFNSPSSTHPLQLTLSPPQVTYKIAARNREVPFKAAGRRS